MTTKLKVALLVGLNLAGITAANLIVTHYGPTYSVYTAFALVGLALITRDRLQDFYSEHRWLKLFMLIAAGAAISYGINSAARTIAIASCVAFAAAESVEMVCYTVWRRKPWMTRAVASGTIGAAVDSVLFVYLAFGWNWPVSFGQWTAKVCGCVLWAAAIRKVRAPKAVEALG